MGNGAAIVGKAWIFRKGNGQLRVHPSPVVVQPGQPFILINLVDTLAKVTFQDDVVEGGRDFDVPACPAGTKRLVVVADPPKKYFEYDVKIGDQYADGGSKPGGIIDP